MMDNELLCLDKDLANVQKELRGTESKWKIIGVLLKLPISCLEEIEKEHKGNTEECNLEMQIAWLKSKKATWKSLVDVLRETSDGFEEKARAIEKKRISPCNNAQHAEHSQNVYPDQQQQFLTEHLEWLLKIGFSLEKIVEWVKTKNRVQISEEFTHQDDHSGENESAGTGDVSINFPDHDHQTNDNHGTNDDHGTNGSVAASSSHSSIGVTAEAKSKKRPRTEKSSKKQPSKKKPRQESLSPIRFSLINSTTERGRQLQIKNNMLQIIKTLKKHPDGREFIEFVKEESAQDYYKIIKYPMCLNEIRDRINRNQCDTVKDFSEEFQAIVDNCIEYNGKDSCYSAQVIRLKDHFDDLVKSYLPEDGILHSLPSPEEELPKVKPEYNSEDSSSDEDQDYLPGNEESQESQESVIGNMEERMISENGYLESSHDSSLSQSVVDEGSPTKSPAAQVSESFKNGSQTHIGTSARTHPKTIGADSVTMNGGVNEDSDDEPPPINWS